MIITKPTSLTTDHDDLDTGYCTNGTLVGVPPSVRAVVGVTCILSMAGALLIIFYYARIKEIRTTTLKILLHLSILDFVVALGNSIGVFVNFDQYLFDHTNLSAQHYEVVNGACKAQAFVSVYGMISSTLWTNCMAAYIYFNIISVQTMEKFAIVHAVVRPWSTYALYGLNYGLPLLVCLWLLLTGKLGYSPYAGYHGWCSVINYDTDTGEWYPLVTVFSNDVWVYLTMIIVTLTYVSLNCNVSSVP